MYDYIVFLGAGASVPFGVLTMTKMIEDFEESLKESTLKLEKMKVRDLYNTIKQRLASYEGYDLEAVITVLQDIIDPDLDPAGIVNSPSIHYFSSWYPANIAFETLINTGLEEAKKNIPAANQLLLRLKKFIINRCRFRSKPFDIYDEFFATVMRRHGFDYRKAIADNDQNINCIIFTTNYDRILEAYCNSHNLDLEWGQGSGGQSLDITRNNKRLYNPSADLFQIYKLHGSINWYKDQMRHMRWVTEPIEIGQTTSLGEQIASELLIYPAVQKYTFREPFYTMFHYLKERLIDVHSKACYVVGYSFRDEDVLGLFLDAMELNAKLEIMLIDSNAEAIKKHKFHDFNSRVKPIQQKFSVDAVKQLEEL